MLIDDNALKSVIKALKQYFSSIFSTKSYVDEKTVIQDGSITSAKLAPMSVTQGKIDSGAVTSGKVATGAITENKLSSEVQEKLNSGGGNNDFVVNFEITYDESENEIITADKTFTEIKSAYDVGKNIRGFVSESDTTTTSLFLSCTDDTITFYCLAPITTYVVYALITVDSDNSKSREIHNINYTE